MRTIGVTFVNKSPDRFFAANIILFALFRRFTNTRQKAIGKNKKRAALPRRKSQRARAARWKSQSAS